MSADFKEETQPTETREHLSEEELIKTLTDEFNSMFVREHLEANAYLVFKMNSSLEIPITAIYKDKKISSICTNLAIIREALSRSSNVTYNREKEVIIPNIKRLKNKIVLNKIPDHEKDKIFKTIYQAPEFIHKSSDKYIENIKSYTVMLRTEQQAESLFEKIKAVLSPGSQADLKLEFEDLYLDLLQRAQEVMKTQTVTPDEQRNFQYDPYYQNYAYYYGMNPYMNAYGGMMGGNPYGYRGQNFNNPYYNSYQSQMFIRKAQDEANEANEFGQQRGEYQGYSGKKKDRYSKKPYFQKQLRSEPKNNKQMSPEEITRRTRVNSENFPPLMLGDKLADKLEEAAREEEVAEEKADKGRLRHHKDDLIKLFKQMEGQVRPNEKLTKFSEKEIPVLNLAATPNLEFIQSSVTGRKNSEHYGKKDKH